MSDDSKTSGVAKRRVLTTLCRVEQGVQAIYVHRQVDGAHALTFSRSGMSLSVHLAPDDLRKLGEMIAEVLS